MKTSAIVLSVLFLAAAAAVASSSDDLTIVSRHTNNGKPAGTSTDYLSSDHVRMGSGSGDETIVDLKTHVMMMLDSKEKTYYTMTKKDMEEFAVKMKEKMNSPEMKQAMGAMKAMTAGTSGAVNVKKTGATRKIAGFGCEEWAITMGPSYTIKECLAKDLQYPVQAFEAYRDFSESMKSMSSAFAPKAKSGVELGEKLKSLKGYPVATSALIDVAGMKMTVDEEVTEVRRGSIPASIWQVPAGYKKIENPMLRAFEDQ